MERELHILILEDNPSDAELMESELRNGGIAFSSRRVETKDAFLKELKDFEPDLIIADYSLPQFDGLSALSIVKERCPEVPFILVLGVIDEEMAIEIFNRGATDYVFKDRLSRLVPSVYRALREAKERVERKRMEETLRQSESKYRVLLENLPQKIFYKDTNSVYVSCNENYARDLKLNPDEIKGKTDYDFYPKELAEKYRTDDKRIIESSKIEHIEEEYIQDGQKCFVHTVKTPIRDDKRNVIGILGIFWDITEKKKMEEEIQKKVKELERFYEMAVGRELRMVELKEEIKRLENELKRYKNL